MSQDVPGAGGALHCNLGAVAANWQALRARHDAPTAAVIKADGYGLGARQVAARLLAEGCRHFFVAHLSEALALCDVLGCDGAAPRPPVLLAVLNGLLPGSETAMAASGAVPVLGSLAEIGRWQDLARRLGRALPCLLHVDTGMARLGLDATEWAMLLAEPARLSGLDVLYLMTHLSAAEMPEHPLNALQLARFRAASAAMPGVATSLANSSGLFLGPDFRSDLARPGAALYGINPIPGQANPMAAVAGLRVQVLQTRWVEAGDPVGYDATWQAPCRSRIATACVGYADGWPRILSNTGCAYFDGLAVPLVGRVSMDLTTYDVTAAPGLRDGDWLELLGPHCPVDEVARLACTNGYEILTSLGARYRRHWHG